MVCRFLRIVRTKAAVLSGPGGEAPEYMEWVCSYGTGRALPLGPATNLCPLKLNKSCLYELGPFGSEVMPSR